MSYDYGAALQSALYARLVSDDVIQADPALVVLDAPPSDFNLPDRYIEIGEEYLKNASSKTHHGAEIDFSIGLYSNADGFSEIKNLAAHVGRIITREQLQCQNAKIVNIIFRSARNYRLASGAQRLVRLWFRAYLDTTQQ